MIAEHGGIPIPYYLVLALRDDDLTYLRQLVWLLDACPEDQALRILTLSATVPCMHRVTQLVDANNWKKEGWSDQIDFERWLPKNKLNHRWARLLETIVERARMARLIAETGNAWRSS